MAAAMSGFDARWITVSWPAIVAVERVEVADVAADDVEPRIVVTAVEVPVAARGEVVVDGDRSVAGSASRRVRRSGCR